jgi:hypothetical protein
MFVGIATNATRGERLNAHAGFALTFLGRGSSSRCEGGKDSGNECRDVDRNGHCGLLGSSLRLRYRSSLYWAIEWIAVEGWAGVETWGRATAFLPAVLRDAVGAVAGIWEALDAHHFFAFTAWDTGGVGELWAWR